jgi:hypothetical protein
MSSIYREDIQNITPPRYEYNIDDIIHHIFPESEFNTQIIESDDGPDRYVYIKDKHQHSCIDFTIKEDSIYVDRLNRCTSGSGTTILQKVEQVAREIGIFKIILMDSSKINTPCGEKVSLQILSLLTSGKTWYNKLGYICENQDELDSRVSLIIETTFEDFIDKIYEIIKEKYPNELIRFKTLIRHLVSQQYINIETTVKNVFTQIKEMLKKGEPCRHDIEPQLVLLIWYIELSNILLIPKPFKTIFTKTLQTNIGKGMKRKRRTKKGSKKRKKKNTKKRTKINKTN